MSENKEEEATEDKKEVKTKEQEDAEKAEKEDEESRKKRLVKGDYMIQVHIIEGRELKGRDFGATSDPMVEVHVMNDKKTTTIMKENLNPLWDERLSFDIRNVEPEDLNQGKCKLMVYDANMIRRNVLIGSFEFDLVSIYYKKHHELFNQWVALVDVTGEHEGVQGFLKVSIVVLGPGDEQYIHSDDEMLELTDLFKPLMPPSIDPDPWLLKAYVWRYEHMAIADRTSQTSDPYVQLEFAAAKVKTTPIKKKLTADVSKCLILKVMEPVLGDQIKVWFKDWDIGVQEDDILGVKIFSWEKAKASEGYPTHWIHLYGAPDLESGDLADKMNKGIIEGCWYRGSVLMRLFGKHIEEGEESEGKQEVTEATWDESYAPPTERWVLQVDVYQAVEVLGGEGKFGIEMRIRNTGYKTEFVSCEKGTVEWCEVLNLDLEGPKLGGPRDDSGTISLSLPKDPLQCPDVIFYLTRKKEGLSAIAANVEYISYRRFKWADLVKLGYISPPQWYEFFPSDVLHKMKDDEFPGTVLLGIRCGTEAQNVGGVNPKARPFLTLKSTTDPVGSLIEHSLSLSADVHDVTAPLLDAASSAAAGAVGNLETMGKLSITVLKANDVPSVDMNGKADPYVKVSVNNEVFQTEPQKGTLNPEWRNGNKFVFEGVSIHDDVTLELWDWNRLKDTFIGKKENILLTGLLQELGKGAGDDFSCVKVYIMDSEKYKGAKVTVSFQWEFDPRQKLKRKAKPQSKFPGLFQKDDKGDQVKSKGIQIMGRPYRKNYSMKVYAYCARDLSAADGNGLSDPYLEISYCGEKAKTETKKKTLNPQWMQELTLNVDVPQPAQYAPRVRCAIYDWDQVGSNDLLARFFIPFQTIREMEKTKKAKWFPLQDKMGQPLEAKGVYLAIELIDPNIRNPTPLFSIDFTSIPFDMHFLVIGVRGLKSSLGVSKPQLVSTVPIAGDMVEVATDPSSDPSPKDANWLVTKKMTLDLPKNFELAPVVSLVIRDNKFGGLIKHDIGNAPLKIDQFMEKIDDEGTDWVVKDVTKKILDENELHTEIKAEEEAEWRTYQAEKRVRELALAKTKSITEARCTALPYDQELQRQVEELQKKELEILTKEQIQELQIQEMEKKSSAMSKVLGRKKAPGTKPNEMDEVPDESDGESEEDAATEAGVASDVESNAEKTKTNDTELVSPTDATTPEAPEKEPEEKKYENPDDAVKQAQEEQEKRLAEEEKQMNAPKEDEKKAEDGGEETGADGKKKKKKKKSQKQKDDEIRKNAEKMLKDWDKDAEEFCFDIDSKVAYNPDDFEPEYLKGRRKVKNELEDAPDLDLKPFEDISLWTGQKGGLKLFGQNRRQVGTLKGLWKLSAHNSNERNPFGHGLKSLLQTRVIACRLYILNGIHLVSTDNDNSSDPYLVVKLGRESFSTRSRYLANTLEPKFHEKFEFRTRLPGPSQITIEVWDWDGIGDDLVGVTVVDIEDRWFSRDWRRLRVKPLEERTLWNPRSQASYGKIRLWVDLFNQDEARNLPMVDISLPPKDKFEMRLIVWKAKDVVIKDDLTEQNDLRVTCKLKLEEWQEQETDIHWRAKFGKGSWNWRCLYPVELPIDVRTQLSMSMWDQDVFAASDSIGEVNIALDLLLKQAYLQRLNKPRLILRKDQTKRFWLDFTHPNFTGVQAKCQISMELMTAEEAAKFPAGIGRSDPNNNPFLPPPEGRLYFSWNPFELLRQLLGNKLCFKLYCIFCIVGCIAIIIFIGPQFFVNLIASILLKAIGL